MKLLAINTSPRRHKHTETLLEEVIRGAENAGAEVEFFSVAEKEMKPCLGCISCRKGGECPLNDDISILLDKIMEADGIVVGAPVFFYNVPAQCKMIMDRSYKLMPINGKKVAGIVTVAGSIGTSEVVKSLTHFFHIQGITLAGYVASYGNSKDKVKAQEVAFKLGKKMVKMSEAIKNADDEAFEAISHFAYGTHTF